MALLTKIILWALIAFIFFSLGSALYFLIVDRGNSERIVKALTWRIGLSILLLILLFFAFAMGWITPHPII